MAEVDGDDNKKRKRSFWSRVWNGLFLFRLHGDDFEKRLQYISREEATLISKMKRRSSSWRSTARNLVVVSVFLEVVALAYAIITTRSVDLDWQMRALRVLPIFLLPAFSSALYWALFCFTRMCDSRDQKTLESLQAERQEKIDELKERTNYYTTQQLIQKYDPDPAAKAAAAAVLASKLSADSGIRMFLEESHHDLQDTGKSNDFEPVTSCGLRKRNTSDATTSKGGGHVMQQSDVDMIQHLEDEVSEVSPPHQIVVEHHNPSASGTQDGGWLAKVAALLVGEDPTQSFALICGNCLMHNGLARKEDFPFITYFCPRCHALNRPRGSTTNSPKASGPTSPLTGGNDIPMNEKPLPVNSSMIETEPSEKTAATSQ
ncbi:unnamed protein product [Lactuca saligna]|uniref:Lunapark zinc ribbon domain-containing protein n=1 Tax=Lactuca saligna TaxID=75948 RepID=A0AA36ENE1_LACSI|nr:unnamed protein product [Lactuca saligna]